MGKLLIRLDDFFTGIVSALVLNERNTFIFNQKFEEKMANVFTEFDKFSQENGYEMAFRIRLHPFHNDSIVAYKGILGAEQKGLISINSREQVITIKVNKETADELLKVIPGGKLFSKLPEKIIGILLD